VRNAANTILTQTNILGDRNTTILIQEFLAGTEYAVDTVSCRGQRKVTGIWEYLRPPGAPDTYVGYDAMLLLPYEGALQEELAAYIFAVLDALGIQQGPAHSEVMWVQGKPVLIEVGARLSAGNNAILSRTCGGICQLDETVESILAPERFLATLCQRPRLLRQAANVFLMPKRPGKLLRVQGLDAIRALPSLYSLSVRSTAGEMIHRVAGLATLVAETRQIIERDLHVIRQWQQKSIFITAEESCAAASDASS
jgi:hypothetical protein